MTYQDGGFDIGEVNIVYENGVDDVTKNRMTEVLSIKGKSESAAVTNAKVDGKTNILAGIYGSDGYVDKYVKEHYTVDKSLFDHHGSYFLASNKGEIVILGLDTDAVFYGITSLKHIFNQMDGTTIRNFEMRDYADVNIRGFIEGYYGLPWSNEDRMSLMRFGGDYKMTSYIFAPKDDEYHKGKWRDLYPEEELAKIKEMVKVGNDSKCRFVWTAHPFMGGFNQAQADQEIQALLRKFDQLYDAGVRQFGVLGDDVGSLPRTIVINMMTKVSEWAKKKGDVYDTVFCPAGYNHSWQSGGTGGNYAELNEYDKGFPEDIKIFWTGEAVCKPIEQVTLDHFRTHRTTDGQKRRAPLFWLNWPVNDINLMMGKGVQLKTDVNPEESLNAYEWTTYDAKKPGDARYIRLINKTNDDVKFNLKQFVINTVEFKEKSLHSKSGNYTITDPEKAFDGNRATEAVYQTSQNEGVWFVYDLGQTIHFDKFKAVCEDSEHDYIRHGKFSVSTDGETWEEIMTLGSQDGPNNGEANDTDEIGAVLPNHETSYNTKEATNINKDARYLKFEVTRTKVGSDKWVRFSELEINDGAYVPSENDPTYESSCLDTQNGKFSYMSDMNLATSFVPAEKSGNLVYHVSEKNDRNKIKIVQRADSISNATVSVRTLAEADTWKPVGTLGKTVNEFVLPNETVLLDVKIEWSDAKVGIIEMFLSKTDAPTPEEKVWTVTLDGKEVKVKDGEKLTKPADPTKEGYKFLGWFVGDKEFNFDTPITEELNGIKIEARF